MARHRPRRSWPEWLTQHASLFCLGVILVGGFALRLAIWTQTEHLGLQIADERDYVQISAVLANGGGFGLHVGEPTSMRPPLYPVILSAIWKLHGGIDYQAARLVQIAIALLNVVALYIVCYRVFSDHTAVLASAILCFYPSLVGMSSFLLTEVLFTALLTLLAVVFQVATEGKHRFFMVMASGVVLGLATLTRSVGWPFLPALLLLVAVYVPARPARKIGLILVCALGFAVVVGPWAYRNTALNGVFVIVDTMGGLNLYMGNYEHTPRNRAWSAVSTVGPKAWYHDYRRENPNFRDLSQGQRDKWAKKRAVEFILQNPWLTVKRSLIKFANFWGLERAIIAGWQKGLYNPPDGLKYLGAAAIVGGCIAVLLLGSLGLCFCGSVRSPFFALALLLLLEFSFVHSLVFGHARYHLPLIPFLAAFAAAAVTGRVWAGFGKNWATCGSVAAGVCLGVVWMRDVLVDAEKLTRFFSAMFRVLGGN